MPSPDVLPRRADVVVVGAGIAGLAIARQLVGLGLRNVVVVERAYPGAGATGRNVARIRAMQLSETLCRVAIHCQRTYEEMGDALGFNVLFYRLGYALVLYDADELERMRQAVEMHARLGVGSRLLSPSETLDRLPILRDGEPVAGAVLSDDAIVHHDAVVWAHLEHLRAARVPVLSGTDVAAVARATSGTFVLETSRGRIETPTVVNGAGGWSQELNRLVGVSSPNTPFRREVLVTAPLRRTVDAAVTFYRPKEGWFNQTLRGEIVMGVVDPDEPPGVQQRSSLDFLRRTATLMTRKAPALADVSVIRQWAGMYDVTPDHLPLVGPTRQLPGWWQANGWSGRGMLLAPGLAGPLAEWLVEGRRPSILEPFDPDRFGDAAAIASASTDYYARYAAAAHSRAR